VIRPALLPTRSELGSSTANSRPERSCAEQAWLPNTASPGNQFEQHSSRCHKPACWSIKVMPDRPPGLWVFTWHFRIPARSSFPLSPGSGSVWAPWAPSLVPAGSTFAFLAAHRAEVFPRLVTRTC
jgi:hypothetical protein